MNLLVTEFGNIRIMPDTCAAIEADIPGWAQVTDRRTTKWRALRQIEQDIRAIAEYEWLHMGELTEF
jgi:hypothetical protein